MNEPENNPDDHEEFLDNVARTFQKVMEKQEEPLIVRRTYEQQNDQTESDTAR